MNRVKSVRKPRLKCWFLTRECKGSDELRGKISESEKMMRDGMKNRVEFNKDHILQVERKEIIMKLFETIDVPIVNPSPDDHPQSKEDSLSKIFLFRKEDLEKSYFNVLSNASAIRKRKLNMYARSIMNSKAKSIFKGESAPHSLIASGKPVPNQHKKNGTGASQKNFLITDSHFGPRSTRKLGRRDSLDEEPLSPIRVESLDRLEGKGMRQTIPHIISAKDQLEPTASERIMTKGSVAEYKEKGINRALETCREEMNEVVEPQGGLHKRSISLNLIGGRNGALKKDITLKMKTQKEWQLRQHPGHSLSGDLRPLAFRNDSKGGEKDTRFESGPVIVERHNLVDYLTSKRGSKDPQARDKTVVNNDPSVTKIDHQTSFDIFTLCKTKNKDVLQRKLNSKISNMKEGSIESSRDYSHRASPNPVSLLATTLGRLQNPAIKAKILNRPEMLLKKRPK